MAKVPRIRSQEGASGGRPVFLRRSLELRNSDQERSREADSRKDREVDRHRERETGRGREKDQPLEEVTHVQSLCICREVFLKMCYILANYNDFS